MKYGLDLCLEEELQMPFLLHVSYRTNTSEKKKSLYFAFADLEKAFDRVPKGVVRWAMRKLNVDESLTETIMVMYEFSNSAVRVNNTIGDNFNVKVGVQQGSVLSPLLLIMVLEARMKDLYLHLVNNRAVCAKKE